MSERVVIVPCADYEPARARAALETLLEKLGGLDWVKPGMRIGIKANLVAAMAPDAAATTHPALLKALFELLRERGAEPVIGDSPGGLYNAVFLNRVYSASGLDCDAVINFCKLKSHGMMGLSAAAKNLFGSIPGTMKPEYHYRFPKPADFADMLVDLDEFWKPRLHIVDAVVAMEGNGPTAGTPRPVGCLLAGENPHRIDLLCAKLIGLDPATVPTLQAAKARGLCPQRLEELEIDGPWEDFVVPGFEIITERNGLQFQAMMGGGRMGELFSRFAGRVIAARPSVEKALCVGCRKCEQICPAKAITMKKKKPEVDRKACIRCFCCQEFCPKGAMKVRRPPVARFLVR